MPLESRGDIRAGTLRCRATKILIVSNAGANVTSKKPTIEKSLTEVELEIMVLSARSRSKIVPAALCIVT